MLIDPFWAVDSTQVHFGQWILQWSILGSGFYSDPFWAVDSTKAHFGQCILLRPILGSGFPLRPILGSGLYSGPFWAVDSTQAHFGQWILHRPILGSGFCPGPKNELLSKMLILSNFHGLKSLLGWICDI